MQRQLKQIIPARATSDGAGVRIRRSLGQSQNARLDPFLMLDEFNSESADDYIGGFPSHPHRGFETVTYMLDGHMLHEDHMGNRGDLKSGDVQWMTAGRGIIHSEMPQQKAGRMRGFQLWINLPAAEKMKPAHYRDIAAEQIPSLDFGQGRVKVIAGTVEWDDQRAEGPIQGLSTEPRYWDLQLEPGGRFEQALPRGLHAFVYLYEGDMTLDDEPPRALQQSQAGLLSDGDRISVQAGDQGARALILAGKPIGEPIAQYGPFVMNTPEEIEQAIDDYRQGRLAV